ncbi:hypothetical protein F5148DRAFT_1178994 [Russula earlei]|uniref:Uncharacterized protein n=1 Tax=Russula earlei TaxID=71964 RepID=A0ACC0UFL9_9AGAM|nr:hypothetical protein F5148DRAFT_1178994 [Russula earlei]
MPTSTSFLDTPRPMPCIPTRLLSSLKRPFSKPKPEPYPLILPDRTREPGPGATPPTYKQIVMGLHLSRTPHFPAHLAHFHRMQHALSSPTSSAPQRVHKARSASVHLQPSYFHSQSQSRSRSLTPSRSPSRSYTRLPPPPARSALKKTRVKANGTISSATPDTASASTVASSGPPSTPTSGSTRPGLLARFLGKDRGATPDSSVIITEPEAVPERKSVRFGKVEEEDESC